MQGLSGTLRLALETYTLNATDFLLPPTKGVESNFTSHLSQVATLFVVTWPGSNGRLPACLAFRLLVGGKDPCPERL